MILRLLHFSLRHRLCLWLCSFALVLLGVAALLSGTFSTRIDGVFPKGSSSARAMELLAESGLSNRLTIDCDASALPNGLEDDSVVCQLISLADELAALPEVRSVRFQTLPDDLTSEMEELFSIIPLLLEPKEVTKEYADVVVKNALKQLMMPAPGTLELLRSDPFGLRAQLLLRLQELRQASGLRFDATKPFLCSEDGRHALIVLELSVPYSDSHAARKLLGQISEILAGTSQTTKANCKTDKGELIFHLVGAHLHTIGNEDTIRRDLTLIGLLSPLFLLALFLLVFRGDWRCLWLPLLPAAATAVVAGALVTINGQLQLFVLGLGGSILGLAVDQGIHIYIACREKNPLPRLAGLARPLALGAGTSVAVFLLLVFTRSPALRQLGLLAGGALALSLLMSFFLLPTLLLSTSQMHNGAETVAKKQAQIPRRVAWLVLAATGVLTVLSLFLKSETSFRVEALDGVSPQVLADEKIYTSTWQPVSPNLLLLRDPQCTATARLHDALQTQGLVSPQDFWPDELTREQNRRAWENAPLEQWRDLLAVAAIQHGLPADFFVPFFDKIGQSLTNPTTEPQGWMGEAYRQLRHGDISVFFLQDENGVQKVLDNGGFDGAFLAPRVLREILTRDFGQQLLWILCAAVILIPLLTLATLRSFRKLYLALLPVLLTLLWLRAGIALAGRPITLMTAIGAVLLIGLAIDYGVFAVQWISDEANSTIPHAMLLSAATTVFTTGILLFSRHPVLFDLGLVLSIGIFLAYCIARFVVPALARL